MSEQQTSYYDAVGGHETFAQLTRVFYEQVARDELMRPMYPDEDLAEAEVRLRMFLEQYWGGPTTYHEQRGHPRLRMRHAPFAVTPRMRDHWVSHMRVALDTLALSPELEQPLWEYLQRAADFMINTPDEGEEPHRPNLLA